VATFLILGSERAEPLQFWWGPISPALLVVLGVIVAGALLILSRVHLLAVAVLFWTTFAASMGILALSGHAFSANWHLGPVADGYFWRVLITSPEVFIFLSFMITDPRTAPETARGRRIYAVVIGLLSSLLIAPQQTEFAAKVALLGSLTIVCAARPLLIVLRERGVGAAFVERARGLTRPAVGVLVAVGAASFVGALVAAGAPARSFAGITAVTSGMQPVQVTIQHAVGVVSLDKQTAGRISADTVADLRLASQSLSKRDATAATAFASGTYLASFRDEIGKAAGRPIVVPSYDVASMQLRLKPARGQAPPTVVATLQGQMTPLTYAVGSSTGVSGRPASFTHTFDLALEGGRFLIIGDEAAKPAVAVNAKAAARANESTGIGVFSKIHLTNVAPKVGVDFRQGAFRYSMSYDPQAMMGGGVCWLDYNGDGWMDLYAVNSYADVDQPEWAAHGGLPRSQLFENVHGRFVAVPPSSGADIRVKGTGCVAADLNGDGRTDLVVTTATGVDILWNDGNGKFTQGAAAAGVHPYGWYSSAAVADVNGDGRPDLFIAGYTNMAHPITNSIAGFPTNYQGVRDLLYLNEGNGPNGRARFKEVGVEAGLEKAHFSHGLGAVFTDVNGDGRPDLYVANDEDANQLYLNERGGPLGFHFVDVAKAWGVADHNAGMGVAIGDYNGDGIPDIFVTNSRGQPHAAYQSSGTPVEPRYVPEMAKFAKALQRHATVGWGDSWVDLANSGKLDLVLANGAIPVTNLKKDTEKIQVLQDLGRGRFTNASGIVSPAGLPKIIGRGLAAADFDNDGRMGIAINTIGGHLVLLENTGPAANWLEVSLKGFHPDAVVTAVLPDGQRLVDELHAGSSYLSSEDPRAHFGLGDARTVKVLTIRYPDGTVKRLTDVKADRILDVG
jgi:ASPIC and UnbV/FG-GAP-like repeat/NQR2, RnfD, RnfE family